MKMQKENIPPIIEAVTKMILTGGGVNLPGFVEEVRSRFNFEIEVADPFIKAKSNRRPYSPSFVAKDLKMMLRSLA